MAARLLLRFGLAALLNCLVIGTTSPGETQRPGKQPVSCHNTFDLAKFLEEGDLDGIPMAALIACLQEAGPLDAASGSSRDPAFASSSSHSPTEDTVIKVSEDKSSEYQILASVQSSDKSLDDRLWPAWHDVFPDDIYLFESPPIEPAFNGDACRQEKIEYQAMLVATKGQCGNVCWEAMDPLALHLLTEDFRRLIPFEEIPCLALIAIEVDFPKGAVQPGPDQSQLHHQPDIQPETSYHQYAQGSQSMPHGEGDLHDKFFTGLSQSAAGGSSSSQDQTHDQPQLNTQQSTACACFAIIETLLFKSKQRIELPSSFGHWHFVKHSIAGPTFQCRSPPTPFCECVTFKFPEVFGSYLHCQ
jgi:hypothetical protein